MFKVLVEFIYSRQKKTSFHQNSSCRNVQHNILSQCQLFNIFHLQVFPFKNSQLQKTERKKSNDLGQFSSISRYDKMETKKLIYAKHVLLIIKTKDYTVIITS